MHVLFQERFTVSISALQEFLHKASSGGVIIEVEQLLGDSSVAYKLTLPNNYRDLTDAHDFFDRLSKIKGVLKDQSPPQLLLEDEDTEPIDPVDPVLHRGVDVRFLAEHNNMAIVSVKRFLEAGVDAEEIDKVCELFAFMTHKKESGDYQRPTVETVIEVLTKVDFDVDAFQEVVDDFWRGVSDVRSIARLNAALWDSLDRYHENGRVDFGGVDNVYGFAE